MLSITQGAADAIRTLVETAGVPERGGMRISIAQENGAQASLQLALSEAPLEGDAVVAEDGAKVFLDETAVEALGDSALDGSVEGDEVSFGIVEQPGPDELEEVPPY